MRTHAFIDRFFGVQASGSTIGRELRGGATTFLTMAYILFVNPDVLSKAIRVEGVDLFPQLLTTTALAAAAATVVMAFVGRYPFALAPGMGVNAYFAFTVVLGQGIAWRTALGAVFISGLLFFVLSIFGLRAVLVGAIPHGIKIGTAAGIGLFLAIIGAETSGLIVDHPATLVTLGDLSSPGVLLTVFGTIAIAAMLAAGLRGALLIGILATSAIAVLSGAPVYAGGKPFGGFSQGILQMPAWPVDIAFQLDVSGALGLGVVGIVFVFFFVDLFDTAGTLYGLAEKAGFSDPQGNLPRASAAFTADAAGTLIGAALGTSTTTTYIESAAGIEEGGKTGLTALVVAALFLLSLFFWPLASAVPPAATAPALLIVGAMMMSCVGRVAWEDYRESVPAFLTIIGMPLTYSIANGISFGIVSYAAINLFSGHGRRVHWLVYLLAAILIARYAWLGAA